MSYNDKELLELAAKAVGLTFMFRQGLPCKHEPSNNKLFANLHVLGWKVWNPLENDGDALQLASILSMDIFINQITVVVEYGDIHTIVSCSGKHDRLSATRRAIVSCAAEIGKGKL